ncbi:MAG: hypothetical protein HOC74_24270, partial [Gemmatimonadetes bacterium]|nr:hypothetical protein [Gemmatimonadota bacterium]
GRLRRGYEEDWQKVTVRGPRSLDDRAWTRFLAGDLPNYPEKILQANFREVCRRLDVVRNDQQDLKKLDVHHWQQVNPVVPEALAHLTCGGPQAIYWGGLTVGRVRYFDPEKERAGLPEDVGALVTGLSDDGVELTLVNLSPGTVREVIVGAGSFGEHQFLEAEVEGERVDVGNRYLTVRLMPGTEIDLKIGMERYCNRPSYAFPWHGEGIPFR